MEAKNYYQNYQKKDIAHLTSESPISEIPIKYVLYQAGYRAEKLPEGQTFNKYDFKLKYTHPDETVQPRTLVISKDGRTCSPDGDEKTLYTASRFIYHFPERFWEHKITRSTSDAQEKIRSNILSWLLKKRTPQATQSAASNKANNQAEKKTYPSSRQRTYNAPKNPFADIKFNEKIPIEEVLKYAGFVKYEKKSTAKNPVYIPNGVTNPSSSQMYVVNEPGKNTCFIQSQNMGGPFYSVWGFIKENPNLFSESQSYSGTQFVKKVCENILSKNGMFATRTFEDMPEAQREPFNLNNFDIYHFDPEHWSTQTPFFPFFKVRSINNQTLRAFAGQFVLASQKTEGKTSFRNLAFPLTKPGSNDIVGLELRGAPKYSPVLDNLDIKELTGTYWKEERGGMIESKQSLAQFKETQMDDKYSRWEGEPGARKKMTLIKIAYKDSSDVEHVVSASEIRLKASQWKGQATGSDKAHGVWKGMPGAGQNLEVGSASEVYWFESGYDAMSFYQLEHKNRDLSKALFVSTGGNICREQVKGILQDTGDKTHYLCFDNDRSGRSFAAQFCAIRSESPLQIQVSQLDGSITTRLYVKGETEADSFSETVTFDVEKNGMITLFEYIGSHGKAQADPTKSVLLPCDSRYKDWNDMLQDKKAAPAQVCEQERSYGRGI